MQAVEYNKAVITEEAPICPTEEANGTLTYFIPDKEIFKDYQYKDEYIESLLKNYVFLNSGLTIVFNGKKFHSRNGLVDLLNENMTTEPLYPIVHLKGEDIEVVITHSNQYGEEYYSFVNGQHTTQGGTHLSAFREALGRVIKEYYNKNFEYSDIRAGVVAAISIKVEEPVFESQTKTKLGSKDMGPDGPSVGKFVGDFIKKELDNYLHKNAETSDALLRKIQESEKERKAIAGVTKLAANGQRSEPAQQETARLPYSPKRHERRQSGRQLHLHYRGRLGKRFYYEKPRSEPASGIQPSRQTVKQFRTDEEDRIRKRRIQFATGCIEHRGWIGRLTLQ